MEADGIFIDELRNGCDIEPTENIFKSIWNEYERVIIESLITSFGLDFIVGDNIGGDVDTIYNVRNLKNTKGNTIYKNKKNKSDYQNKETYNSAKYHSDPRYVAIKRKVSQNQENGTLTDAYTGKGVTKNADIDLDHAVSAKEIHDDPGRLLAGLNGTDLANCEENLKPTDRSINRSMQDKDMDAYLQNWEVNRPNRQKRICQLKSKASLTDKEQKELTKLEKLENIDPNKMRTENKNARNAYNAKINCAYYTSPKFALDAAKAAGKRGAQMGARQALGFVFIEVWFVTKEELQKLPPGTELKETFETVGHGIRKGIESAKSKYKDIVHVFLEGAGAGALASLTTTICNIFFTTAKNIVKCIRQVYASVVQAGKVLLFNPDNLLLGDRIKSATIIIATGASVLVGTTVGEVIGKTPLGTIPVIGDIVQVFCSTLVSGLISCSLLICLDRSKFMNRLINALNALPSEVNNFAEIAATMESLAAKLEKLDIEKFKNETEQYKETANLIATADNNQELNTVLLTAYEYFGILIPWEGDFDTFMGNKSNHLVFS